MPSPLWNVRSAPNASSSPAVMAATSDPVVRKYGSTPVASNSSAANDGHRAAESTRSRRNGSSASSI